MTSRHVSAICLYLLSSSNWTKIPLRHSWLQKNTINYNSHTPTGFHNQIQPRQHLKAWCLLWLWLGTLDMQTWCSSSWYFPRSSSSLSKHCNMHIVFAHIATLFFAWMTLKLSQSDQCTHTQFLAAARNWSEQESALIFQLTFPGRRNIKHNMVAANKSVIMSW